MSSCDLTGTFTSLIISIEIQTISHPLHFKLSTADLQDSDIYLWLCIIKKSGRQLQITLCKYLEEVWQYLVHNK